MKSKLQITAVFGGIVGLAAIGIWLAVHYNAPGWLILCIPLFALLMA